MRLSDFKMQISAFSLAGRFDFPDSRSLFHLVTGINENRGIPGIDSGQAAAVVDNDCFAEYTEIIRAKDYPALPAGNHFGAAVGFDIYAFIDHISAGCSKRSDDFPPQRPDKVFVNVACRQRDFFLAMRDE